MLKLQFFLVLVLGCFNLSKNFKTYRLRKIQTIKVSSTRAQNISLNRGLLEGQLEKDAEWVNPQELYNTSAERDFLNGHNEYRLLYEIPIIRIDEELNILSRKWAAHLASVNRLYHEPDEIHGENLFRFSYSQAEFAEFLNPQRVIENWFKESRDLPNSITEEELSHTLNLTRISDFTQMLWKKTSIFGVGFAPNKVSKNFFIVCKYYPKGNINGQYDENVFQPRKEILTNALQEKKTRSWFLLDFQVYLILRFFVLGITLLIVQHKVKKRPSKLKRRRRVTPVAIYDNNKHNIPSLNHVTDAPL